MRDLLLILALLNLALLVSVFVRRLVKQYLFIRLDERRFRWAGLVDQALRRGKVAEQGVQARSDADRITAEEVLFQRWATATPAERSLIRSLFYRWGIFEWCLDRLRRAGNWEQARSAVVLGRLQCHEALSDIVRLLRRAPSESTTAVLYALGLLGEAAVIDVLVQFLLQRGPRHSRPVVSALIGCARTAPHCLSRYLNHPLPWMRVVAAATLAEVASSGEVSVLLQATSDPDPEVRAKVARALGRAATTSAAEGLMKLASDPFWYVRMHAIRALARMEAPGITDQFWRAVRDKNWRVREEAARALYNSSKDALSLLRRIREEIKDRYSVGAFVSVLEREGVTWQAIDNLCSPKAEERESNRALTVELIRAGKFTSVLYALQTHRDPCVRREVSRLIGEFAPPAVHASLKKLLASAASLKETHQQGKASVPRPGR